MAGHLELLTPVVAVEEGHAAEASVRVRNDGEGIEAFELELTGAAAAWARLEPAHLAVRAGQVVEARIVFDVPRTVAAGLGEIGYRVRLSWASDVTGVTADGVIDILGQPEISAALRPAMAQGRRSAVAYVDLRNAGTASTRVSVSGGGDDVDMSPEPESVVVDGGLSESVRLRLRPRVRGSILRADVLDFQVAVEPLHGEAMSIAGQFRRRPLVVTLVPVVVVAMLVIGLVAAAIMARDTDSDTVVGTDRTTAPTVATTAAPTTTSAPSTTTTSAPPAGAPAPVPPELRRIAFQTSRDGNFEIYSVDANGEGAVNLTNHPAHDSEPAWSPDGHRVAFDSDRDGGPGQFEIYVMNGDGTGIVRLTDAPGPDGYPTWSPDGSKIAFISFRDGNSEIYVMALDGTGESRRLTRHPGDDVHPAWSPDGESLVFASNRTGDYELWSMQASDGTGLTRLTDSPGADLNPAWSPDGARIAFDSTRAGDREIYVMAAGGAEAATRLTESPAGDLWPAWSADGGTIAFASSRDGDEELYAIAVREGAPSGPPRRLTTSTGTDSEPAW